VKYHFLDQYREMDSVIHRLDARAKFLSALVVTGAVVFVGRGEWWVYAVFLIMNTMLLALSRVPWLYVLKRSAVVFPFVFMIAVFLPFINEGTELLGFEIGSWHIGMSVEGLLLAADVLCKAWISVLPFVLLTATTSMSDLLKGLEKLRMPAVIVMLVSFMYRYLFIVTDEAKRLLVARNCRSFGGGIVLHMRVVGYMAGSLFLRSYERGERVYGAMLLRGYDGSGRSMSQTKLRFADVFFMIVVMLFSIIVALLPTIWRIID